MTTHTFDPKAVRAAWEPAFPSFQPQDTIECVLSAIVTLYHAVKSVNSEYPLIDPDDWEDLVPEIEEALGEGGHKEGHQCGEQALLALSFFAAWGYDVRPVALFEKVDEANTVSSTGEPLSKTHVGIEIFVEGDWRAADPYFGCMFENVDGDFVSWSEIHMNVFQRTPGNICASRGTHMVNEAGNVSIDSYAGTWRPEIIARNIVWGGSQIDSTPSYVSLDNQYWDGKVRYNQVSIAAGRPPGGSDMIALYSHNVYTQFHTFTPG